LGGNRVERMVWKKSYGGGANFSIQGYKRNRHYPDFVVQRQKRQEELPFATVLVVESKGIYFF